MRLFTEESRSIRGSQRDELQSEVGPGGDSWRLWELLTEVAKRLVLLTTERLETLSDVVCKMAPPDGWRDSEQCYKAIIGRTAGKRLIIISLARNREAHGWGRTLKGNADPMTDWLTLQQKVAGVLGRVWSKPDVTARKDDLRGRGDLELTVLEANEIKLWLLDAMSDVLKAAIDNEGQTWEPASRGE